MEKQSKKKLVLKIPDTKEIENGQTYYKFWKIYNIEI